MYSIAGLSELRIFRTARFAVTTLATLLAWAVISQAYAAQPPALVQATFVENGALVGYFSSPPCTSTQTKLGAAESDCDSSTAAFTVIQPNCYTDNFRDSGSWFNTGGNQYVSNAWEVQTQYESTVFGSCINEGNTPWSEFGSSFVDGSCPSGYALGWLLNDSFGNSHGDDCMTPAYIKEHDTGCLFCALAQLLGDPIDANSGNKLETVIDYKGAGPFPLLFSRSYNSLLGPETHSLGNYSAGENMGPGWTTNIGAHLYVTPIAPNPIPCVDPATNIAYYCPYVEVNSPVQVTIWHADGSQEWFELPNPPSTIPAGTVFQNQQLGHGQLTLVNLPSPYSGTGFSYLRTDGYMELYNSTGQLLSITNPNGLSQTFQYNGNSQVTSIADPFGRQLTFTYNSAGLIATMKNPLGGTYTYSYDQYNRLLSVQYPDNSLVQYTWFESGTNGYVLTGIIDENGNRYATWTYDNQNRAISSFNAGNTNSVGIVYNSDGSADVTEATGLVRHLIFTTINGADLLASTSEPCAACGDKTKTFTYDANGFVASKTDFDGNVTLYVHDGFGNETSRTEAYGTSAQRTITTQWNTTLNEPTLITEPGRTTGYTYDTQGRVLTKTITDTATNVARTTTYAYNSSGLLASVTDPLNHAVSYTYDSQGNLATITNALNQVTQITSYDANGMPLTIVDPNDVTTTLTYDPRQRLLTRTVAGAKTSFTYDKVGNLTQVTLPTGSYLKYSYDAAHRLTGITDAAGDSIVYTLDTLGNRTAEKTYDPSNTLQKTLQRTYNNLNQLTSTIGGMSQTTNYTDDLNGNVTSIKDPLTYVTGQGFDALNRLISVVDPASGNTSYNYDALDRVTDVTDPRNLNTTYSYDAFGDVTQQVSPDTGTTAYTYDLNGNRLTKTDAKGIMATYGYDVLNRLTSIIYPDTTVNVTYAYDQGTNGIGHLTGMTDKSGSTAYSYDARGNLIQKVVTIGAVPLTVAYQYDTADNLTGITYPDSTQVIYTRDAAERVTAVAENSNSVVSAVSYKPFGRITGLTYGNGLVETRSYDADYRLTGITATGVQGLSYSYNADNDITGITDSITSGNSQTLGYDNLNRLTSATGAYGSLGYTYDSDGNRLTEIVGSITTTYTPDTSDNRLASLSGGQTATFSYDANGNLTRDGTHAYGFDATNRLASVDTGTTASYLLNGLGQRVEKTAGSSILFVYDESGHLLGEYDSSGNLVREHIWLSDRPVGVLTSTGLDYVQTDQLNTPRVITGAGSAVEWSLSSDPFGNGQPTGALTYNLRFPGQYYDTETGHNYNYMRDYDPSIGRYAESDPIGLKSGVNTYTYVGGNPINKRDLLGLCDTPDCNKVKSDCIAKCADSTLPTKDYGFSFWNCVNKCMRESGCDPLTPLQELNEMNGGQSPSFPPLFPFLPPIIVPEPIPITL